MITPELRKFIQDNVQKGYSIEEISQSLVAGGWKESDALSLVNEFTGEQNITAGAQLPPADPEIVATAPKEEPSGYSGLRVEEPPLVPVTVLAPQSSVATEPPTVEYFQPARSKWVLPSIVVLIVLLVGAAGASAYYLLVNKTPSPETVLLNMKEAMNNIHSYTFDTKFSFDVKAKPKGDLLQQVNQFGGKGTEGAIKLSFTANGSAVMGESATTSAVDVLYDTNGNASYGAVSVVLDGGANIRVVNGKVYVRLVKIPQLLSMFGMSETLAPWENKWIIFDPTAPASPLSSMMQMSIGDSASSTLTKDNRERATMIFAKDWPLTLSVPKDSMVSVGGIDTYHYKFVVDKKKLASLFDELSTLYPKKDLRQDPVTVKETIDSAVELLAGTTGDLYIGKNDFYLYRASVHIPIDVATSSVEVSGTIDLEMTGSLYNVTPQIVSPENSTAVADVYSAIMQKVMMRSAPPKGELVFSTTTQTWITQPPVTTTIDPLEIAKAKSRDAKRISDIGMLRLGLELYFDAHQSYPLTLLPLVTEKFLPSRLTDPSTKNGYGYHPFTSYDSKERVGVQCKKFPCNSYMLGASLEVEGNSVLQKDADVFFVTYAGVGTKPPFMVGNDSVGCFKEKNLYCYDIVP